MTATAPVDLAAERERARARAAGAILSSGVGPSDGGPVKGGAVVRSPGNGAASPTVPERPVPAPDDFLCRKGCGRVLPRAGPRAIHEKACPGPTARIIPPAPSAAPGKAAGSGTRPQTRPEPAAPPPPVLAPAVASDVRLQLHISFEVPADEFATWSARRIEAFFAALATAVRARSDLY